MPSKAVADAFEARLRTWPNIAACPFVESNEVSAVQAPPYIEIEYPVGDAEFASVGVRFVNRESGGARFIITIAANFKGWKSQVLTWADELADLFRAEVFDGIETFQVSPPLISRNNLNAGGTLYSVPFVVTYKLDSIKG